MLKQLKHPSKVDEMILQISKQRLKSLSLCKGINGAEKFNQGCPEMYNLEKGKDIPGGTLGRTDG